MSPNSASSYSLTGVRDMLNRQMLVSRDSDGCNALSTSCDQAISTPKVIGITIGTVGGLAIVVVTIVVLILHRRKRRLEAKEDAEVANMELEGDFDEDAYGMGSGGRSSHSPRNKASRTQEVRQSTAGD